MSDKEMKYVGTSKKDIWDRMKKLEGELNAQPTMETTTDVAAKTIATKAVKAASDVSSESLNDFVEKVTEAKDQYSNLIMAITAKKDELKDIHGIEAEANTLIAIIGTKDRLVAEKTDEAASIIADANVKADDILSAAKEKDIVANTTRTRERAEFEYSFSREKTAKEDALKDVLDARTKVLDAREAALKLREDDVTDVESMIEGFQTQIAEFDETLKSAVDTAVEGAKSKAATSAAIAANSIKKANEADMKISEARIATLEEKTTELTEQVKTAQDAVKDANDKVSSMAEKALQSNADIKTLTEVKKPRQ